MKSIFTVVALFFSLNIFASFQCGTSAQEIKYPNLNWVKVALVKLNNSIQNTEGIICAGITKGSHLGLSRIVYRDAGQIYEANLEQLKAGLILVSDKTLPPEATAILRAGDYVSIKLLDSTVKGSLINYNLSLRLLRNLSKGLKAKDFRMLNFSATLDQSTGDVDTILNKDAKFDEIELTVSTLPTQVEDINFYEMNGFVKTINANNLPKVDGLL